MTSARRRNSILSAVGMKMAEEGKSLTKREYDRCKSVPIRSSVVLNHFGSWSRFINILQTTQPQLWAEITNYTKEVVPTRDLKTKDSGLEALKNLTKAAKAVEPTKDGSS